jgi:3-oxoacyl-[acyl-carrier protein] reductase
MSDRRHILITGASRGLGRYLASHYLDQGDLVIGCARSGASESVLAHERYRHYSVDVTDAPAVHTLLRNVQREVGLLLSQAAIRLLRKSSAPRIVNMSSIAVPLRLAGEAVYAASKSAIETLTRVAARELGTFGITCNAVGPTPIDTDLLRGVGKEKIRRLVEQQAVPHMAQPGDVAHAVDFFLHPASHMITGQVIYLGGLG